MTRLASALTGTEGERIALADVSVSAVLRDLLSEVSITQTYRNEEKVSIEAVYTFPLPLDAVLLELQVEIGGRVLEGVVVEKPEAEERYEDAVAGGDAAVMLSELEPGLYTMNVGNLLPGETATITFRYAMLYRWAGDRLRLSLPTTVAPRFGESPHRPHEAPETSLTVENQFSLQFEVYGSLRDAQFDCPSHPFELVKSGDRAVLSLRQTKAVMDRDFVLNVKAPRGARSFIWCDVDDHGSAALASFQPFFPSVQQARPLSLAIVIDCSGSMSGDSIAQAKLALGTILDSLQPSDRMTLIAFGSSFKAFSEQLLECSPGNLEAARAFTEQLEADMGGTRIEDALAEVYQVLRGMEAADLFLLTDGAVANWANVVRKAKRTGHRFFTVGVGSAVSEAFVRQLASKTGGACELVTPREGMAERVVRHFERMRTPRARRVSIGWPEGAVAVAPATPGAVFAGDTVLACARFEQPLTGGRVVLEIETDSGEVVREELPLAAVSVDASADRLSTVARVAAAMRLDEMDDAEGRDTALRYRLVSPWTSWLVVAERAEADKALDLPSFRKVPQTLAAGWGGMGSVARSVRPVPALWADRSASLVNYDAGALHHYSLEAFGGGDGDRAIVGALTEAWLRLRRLVNADPASLDVAHALELLKAAGFEDRFLDVLELAAELGVNRNAIAAIVLADLLSLRRRAFLSRGARDALAVLKAHARRAMGDLQKTRRYGTTLGGAIRKAVERGVLLPGAVPVDEQALGMLGRLDELCKRLEATVEDCRLAIAGTTHGGDRLTA